MNKRLGSIVVSAALVLSMAADVMAADPSNMQDIGGHWAEESIGWCMGQELFRGVSETEFAPELPMTRGMFVVVLGRIAKVCEADYQNDYLSCLYTDVKPEDYFAPYVNWATRYGIVNGMGDGSFHPNDPVTREQMAAMVVRFASNCSYVLNSVDGEYAGAFTDIDQVSDYAVGAVETLRDTGLLNGFPGGDGSYYFDPQKTATRAECAAMFQRVANALHRYEDYEPVAPTDLSLAEASAEMHVGQTMPMIATVSPEDATNQTLTWVSMDPAVATVDHNGTVTAVSAGTAEIRGYTWNGLCAACTVTCKQMENLAYAGETYAEKCIRIYGKVVDNYKTYYDSEASNYEKAVDHLVTIPVQVWDFADSSRTVKITKTIYLQVHENIADTVQAIFEEIYNGDEQFPIKSAGGYYDSMNSEHHPGLAVDINPDENYECDNNGKPMTGLYWKPGEDPYSIPPDGDVVNAFRKYGFGWGGTWNSKKDYMHFSYFGT